MRFSAQTSTSESHNSAIPYRTIERRTAFSSKQCIIFDGWQITWVWGFSEANEWPKDSSSNNPVWVMEYTFWPSIRRASRLTNPPASSRRILQRKLEYADGDLS